MKTQLGLVKIFNASSSVNKFWNKNCCQREPKFNDVYSRNNLFKIKSGTYIINLDAYESLGTHWIALYVNGNNVMYLDSFEVENISKEFKKIIGNKNIITNIYRIQSYNSIMCVYISTGFIDFMWRSQSLLD